jgi:hypothetical protein
VVGDRGSRPRGDVFDGRSGLRRAAFAEVSQVSIVFRTLMAFQEDNGVQRRSWRGMLERAGEREGELGGLKVVHCRR